MFLFLYKILLNKSKHLVNSEAHHDHNPKEHGINMGLCILCVIRINIFNMMQYYTESILYSIF